MFVLRLSTEVDFSNEQNCIQQTASEIAFYYARYVDFLTLQSQAISYGHGADNNSDAFKQIEAFKFALEHDIMPEMKRQFVVRKKFALFDDLTFSMVTCTENLYKVFERC